MKAMIMVILALLLAVAEWAVESSRNEVVWWEEDFEGDTQGWTHYSVPANMWHSVLHRYYDPWGGYEYSVITLGGGYRDSQYLVLDTPERIITDNNPYLHFTLDMHIQDIGGANPPYDGCDALNVRISTNGGASWTTIQGSPAYNISSSHAFGAEFMEGPLVPGWGGDMYYSNVTFNLSAYIGQSVKIRFAFASDATISSDAYYINLQYILFGGYGNEGYDDVNMTVANLGIPPAEDIWQVAVEPNAPSPIHVAKCQNAQGGYSGYIRDYLVSPPILLPSIGTIWTDFMLRGVMADPDYFGWEISGADGIWHSMGNWGMVDETMTYPTPPSAWASMTECYPAEVNADISDYAGQTVRFRWYLVSYQDSPTGIGLMLDDLKICHQMQLAPPEELVACVSGHNVLLTWAAPGTGGGHACDMTGYIIYRDDTLVGTIAGNLLSYTDTEVPGGWHSYYISGLWGYYETDCTCSVLAFVLPDTYAELLHDDGTAESGFDLFDQGAMGQAAVSYRPTQPVTLRYIRAYVHTLDNHGLILRVNGDSGTPGQPGTQVMQFHCPQASLNTGWNCITLPEAIALPAGEFYIGTLETANTALLGLDESSQGCSYQNLGDGWAPISTGELMLHAIVENPVANDDAVSPPLILDLRNYPNPFNPETTISYTLPSAGSVSLDIYNSRGQLIRTLLHEEQSTGAYSLVWNGRDDHGSEVSSGVYLYRLSNESRSSTRKMLLLK